MTGEEKGIKWEVIDWKSPADITIYDLDGNILHTERYEWIHEPVFGPDVEDCREIDKILDRLISQYGKDEVT
jgi:hypothetical protein